VWNEALRGINEWTDSRMVEEEPVKARQKYIVL